MNNRRLMSVMLAAVMTAGLLAGCGSSSGSGSAQSTAAPAESGSSEASTETASAGGDDLTISITDGSEDSMELNTAKAGTLNALSLCRHVYEGLYKLDKDGKIVPGEAKDVQVSDDGLTYTFTLRDDITWSDGQPVKAADYVYGWKYLKESGEDYSSFLDVIKDAQAKDDKTLVVTLANPCSYLDSLLAFPSSYPVREDYVEKYGDSYATDPDKAVYNGAYTLSSWTHQQEMVLTKRDDYYDASNITVGTINWELMSDPSTMANSYRSGDVIFSASYPEEEADSFGDDDLHFVSGYNTYCAMFNLGDGGNEVLKDAKVRKALSLAIDRDRIINIRGLNDEVATTYTPSGLQDDSGKEFNSTVTPWFGDDYDENCKEAKELLKEAGYEDGKGFPALRYIVNNDSRKTVAEAIVSDWKDQLGIDSVTVETVDDFFSARSDGDYDIAYFGWYMDYPDVSNMLYTMTTGQNDAKYSNDKYDEAYNKAISTTDAAESWKDYDECESILAEDVPVAPILHAEDSYLFDSTDYDGMVYSCGNAFFGYVTAK